MKYSAFIEYDQRRLGYAGCVGLKSREEATAWLERAFVWQLCWYKSPSVYIETRP